MTAMPGEECHLIPLGQRGQLSQHDQRPKQYNRCQTFPHHGRLGHEERLDLNLMLDRKTFRRLATPFRIATGPILVPAILPHEAASH